jgi:hypothetical protein
MFLRHPDLGLPTLVLTLLFFLLAFPFKKRLQLLVCGKPLLILTILVMVPVMSGLAHIRMDTLHTHIRVR